MSGSTILNDELVDDLGVLALNETSLYDLCSRNETYEKIDEYLTGKTSEINEYAKNGDTCLCIACQKGHEQVVKVLIKHSVDVNKCRTPQMSNGISSGVVNTRRQSRLTQSLAIQKGDSPLFLSVKYGFDSISALLIDANVDIFGLDSVANPEFDRSLFQETIRLGRVKTLDKILQHAVDNEREIRWILSKRYDILRQIFIGENIQIIRTCLPFLIENNRIDAELLTHILNYLLMKSKNFHNQEKSFEILENVMEIGTLDDGDESSEPFVLNDLAHLVKGFLATLRAMFNTVGSDDNRTAILFYRSSLFFFILKYHKEIVNFETFYGDIDFTFQFFYSKMKETGENVLKLVEFFICFFDTLITMNHIHLTATNVTQLLRLEHVKQLDVLGEFLIHRSLTPLDLKELCRLRIKKCMTSFSLYSINQLPILDKNSKEFLYFL